MDAAFADNCVAIEELIAEGDKAVFGAMQRGGHRGPFAEARHRGHRWPRLGS